VNLVRYDQARVALYEARTVDDAKDIKDKAEALLIYARQTKDAEMEAWVAEIKLRAMRRIGELSAELDSAQGKRTDTLLPTGGKKSKEEALKDAGISKSSADRCEKIAEMPENEFDGFIAQKKAKGQAVTASEVYRKVTKEKQRERRKEERAELASILPTASARIDLRNEPCANALNGDAGSVDWIVTDPPYPKEYLHLYDTLAEIADHALKPGGSVLCMTGHLYVPEVITALAKRLRYHWILAYLTPGGQAVQIFPRKVNTFWKPVLWFVKGEYAGEWVGDVSRSKPNDNDKRFHEWGQSESGFRDLMSRFVKPGDVVLDPFMGAGTTGVIARELGARFVGFDSDRKAFDEAVVRIDRAELVA
jgi:site-specific DNA-methyltransferase (adenine-specific)